MSTQKEIDDSFYYPLDTPQRQNIFQKQVSSYSPNGIYSPSQFIQASLKSKSIFQKKSPQNHQNNSTKKAKMNKSYIHDFDQMMSIYQYNFNNSNKSASIHSSLCSLFRENNIEVKIEKPKEESSLINYLENIQQQMEQIESSVVALERKIFVNNQKIQEPITQSNNNQLVYINQNVQGLVGRLQDILMQKNLLTVQTQPNPDGDEQQTIYTFNRNLNRVQKAYKCRFCKSKFVKACSLGGHISRTHKEESKQLKLNIPIRKNKNQKKEKNNQTKMK